MSATNFMLTEEELLCCICLDVFTDPVTLPCGHNFCKDCITHHLSFNSKHQCPLCKELVDRHYKPGVNTFISGMAVQFRQSVGKKARSGSHQQVAKPVNISCNAPTRTKRTTLKCCLLLALSLTCLTIYFTTNLKLHQLLDTLQNVAGDVCATHGKPVDLYCKNEKTCICRTCAESDHKFHNVVPLKEEYEVRKIEVMKIRAEIQQDILERQLKNQEIKYSVKLSKDAADREMADGGQFFATLIQYLKKAQAELIGMIEEEQKMTEKQAKGFIQELDEEISELMRRRAEVEQLLRSKDHLHFLQSSPSPNAAPRSKGWTEVSMCPAYYRGTLRTAIVSALDQLSRAVTNKMEALHEAEQKSMPHFAVDVTLDPDTAHPALIVSGDGRQVRCGDEWRKLPSTAKRFDLATNVLGKQSFSCQRFHYDVQVKGKTAWTLGVAAESVSRKGEIKLSPENGYWTICLRDADQYFALGNEPARLSVNYQPEKLRVFVDYEEGLVSFYDVDAAVLLYSFTGCSFTEKLHPFFSPGSSDGGRNSAPLIIPPVRKYGSDSGNAAR